MMILILSQYRNLFSAERISIIPSTRSQTAPSIITLPTIQLRGPMETTSTLTHKMTIFPIFRVCPWTQSLYSFGTSEKCGHSIWNPRSSRDCLFTFRKRSCRPPLSRWGLEVMRILFALGSHNRPKQTVSSCGTWKTILRKMPSTFSPQLCSSKTVMEILMWLKTTTLSTAPKDVNSNVIA